MASTPGLQRLRGLVAGGGAEIEKCLARFEAQQRHDGLRADILDAPAACVSLRLLERRARDAGGGFGAVAAFPAGQQPLGAGEFDLAGGPRHRFAGRPCAAPRSRTPWPTSSARA